MTIFEMLQDSNDTLQKPQASDSEIDLAKHDLNIIIKLLQKQYPLCEYVRPLIEEYGTIDHIPNNPLINI